MRIGKNPYGAAQGIVRHSGQFVAALTGCLVLVDFHVSLTRFSCRILIIGNNPNQRKEPT